MLSHSRNCYCKTELQTRQVSQACDPVRGEQCPPVPLGVPLLPPHPLTSSLNAFPIPACFSAIGVSGDLKTATNLSHFQSDIIDRLSLQIVGSR